MKYKFTAKRLAIMQAYFDIYNRYLSCVGEPYSCTLGTIVNIDFYVHKCLVFIDQYKITKEELHQYNLIYRVSID